LVDAIRGVVVLLPPVAQGYEAVVAAALAQLCPLYHSFLPLAGDAGGYTGANSAVGVQKQLST